MSVAPRELTPLMQLLRLGVSILRLQKTETAQSNSPKDVSQDAAKTEPPKVAEPQQDAEAEKQDIDPAKTEPPEVTEPRQDAEAEKPDLGPKFITSEEHGKVKVRVDHQKVGPAQAKRNSICQILVFPPDKKHFQLAQITPKEPITMKDAYDICVEGAKLFAAGGKDKDAIKRFLSDEIKKLYASKYAASAP